MGAGILPTCIHKNKLYFLFGKENKYADTPGFAEFGGGNDNKESHFETAVREGTEELTGFLGSEEELKKMLKKYGTYNIDWKDSYRTHIFPMHYDQYLPHYYNNNQRFLQRKLDPKLIKDSKIFEKAEIKWFCVDDLMKQKKEFRSYYQNIVDMIYAQREQIYLFIKKANLHKKNNNTKKANKNKYNKTCKHR
jgi:8-oxo-dGTP pyrophosphatase MutT (NUDIX family)